MVFTSAGLIALAILLYLYLTAAIHNTAIIVPLSLLIVFTTSYAVFDQALMLFPWSVVEITIQANHLYAITRDQAKHAVIVLPTTTVNVHLTMLNLQHIDSETNEQVKNMMMRCGARLKRVFFSKQHIVVIRDKCAHSQNFRRLRVWLRYAAIEYR